jgi:type III secretion protein Q
LLSLSAGRESFPLSLLRAVEPGDVLLFAARARQAGSLTLEWSSHALWTADLADGTVTLGNAVHRPDIQEISMDNTRQAAASPSPPRQAATPEAASGKGLSPAEIDALELPLTLELAEIRLSIGELTALAPGHTLLTDASLDAPITLKISGRVVGRGRLVEVGDRLGVLVSSLNLDGADDLAARADVVNNATRADVGSNTTRADAGSDTARADVGNNTARGSGQ